MTQCEFLGSCNFFNEQSTDMPYTREHIKKMYCNGVNFTECAIHMIARIYGEDKVPKNLYPNDVNKLLDFGLLESQRDFDMYQLVIYTNGTSAMVSPSKVIELKRCGEIIAFLGSNGWEEVRRKGNRTYNHVNRRQTKPVDFYSRFYL